MPQNFRIAVPLAMAILLVGVFVLLMNRTREEPQPAPQEPVAEAAKTLPTETASMFGPDVPKGPVEAPSRAPVKKRFYGREDGLHRWNLESLPKGWDPALAKSIHVAFELMDELEAAARSGASAEDLEAERQRLKEFLAGLDPDALPTLDAILNHEQDFVYRRFMYNAIGEMGPKSESATWYLRDYFVKRQKDPQNRSEVGNVIKAMQNLQNETSFEVLQTLIADQQFRSYHEKLIFALGRHQNRVAATGLFVDGLHESTSKKQRLRHAQALGEIQDEGTLPDLYHAFSKENYWVNKQTILGSIGKIGHPNSIPFLEEQARSAKEGAVRLAAGRALYRIGTPHAVETLRTISESEPDANVRGSFTKWLGE